jgi:cytochrome b561
MIQPRERYSAVQIFLHWAIVLLIAVQWLSHEAMEDFWDLVEHEEAVGLPADPLALAHAASGATVLLLMAGRILMRLRYGAPPLPRDTPPILRLAAHANHLAFYLVLVLLPLSGAIAVLFAVEDAADLHESLMALLFVLIALHIGGVAFHTFVRRDRLLWRMLPQRFPRA